MPLSKKGKEIKRSMREQYDTKSDPDKGERIFWAGRNKHKGEHIKVDRETAEKRAYLVGYLGVAASNWWTEMSPLERHAYLTAHPNSRMSKQKLSEAPPINSREDYHKASAAFHRGRVEHHRQQMEAAFNAPDSNLEDQYKSRDMHLSLRNAHQDAREKHERALESLRRYRNEPVSTNNLEKYRQDLSAARHSTQHLENLHQWHEQPIGVGITKYVEKKE